MVKVRVLEQLGAGLVLPVTSLAARATPLNRRPQKSDSTSVQGYLVMGAHGAIPMQGHVLRSCRITTIGTCLLSCHKHNIIVQNTSLISQWPKRTAGLLSQPKVRIGEESPRRRTCHISARVSSTVYSLYSTRLRPVFREP